MSRHLAACIALGAVACTASPAAPPAQEAPLVVGVSPAASGAAPLETSGAPPAPIASAGRDGPEVAARDPRRSMQTPRAAALLVVEVQQLETLLGATPTASADRPLILRRTAEDYCELAASFARDGKTSRRDDARARAIERYDKLLDEHPQYAARDEAIYFDALERELAGDLAKARKGYYDLIKVAPTSKYVSYAYFAFGEMFFTESRTDPAKKDLARQAYGEALKGSPGPPQDLADEVRARLSALDAP